MARAALLCAAFAAVAHGACPMDPNGVAGASCREVCECGSKPCSADVEGPDYSRCINHDGFFDRLDEDDHDCADAIRCCVPLEECAPACSSVLGSRPARAPIATTHTPRLLSIAVFGRLAPGRHRLFRVAPGVD